MHSTSPHSARRTRGRPNRMNKAKRESTKNKMGEPVDRWSGISTDGLNGDLWRIMHCSGAGLPVCKAKRAARCGGVGPAEHRGAPAGGLFDASRSWRIIGQHKPDPGTNLQRSEPDVVGSEPELGRSRIDRGRSLHYFGRSALNSSRSQQDFWIPHWPRSKWPAGVIISPTAR